jgi:fructokinase
VTDIEAPRYTIREPAAWDALRLEEHHLVLAKRASAVCFGTLIQRSRISRMSLHAFLDVAGQAIRLYDVNFRQDYDKREWVEASLLAAHAVKLNEQEVVHLSHVLDVAPATPETLANYLAERYQVEVTCVTRGDRGCVLIEGGTVADVSGWPVRVADAVGAGDAFSAAFLAARLARQSLEVTARFANAVGALVATRTGAMPRLEDQYRALREDLFERGCDAPAQRTSGRPRCEARRGDAGR